MGAVYGATPPLSGAGVRISFASGGRPPLVYEALEGCWFRERSQDSSRSPLGSGGFLRPGPSGNRCQLRPGILDSDDPATYRIPDFASSSCQEMPNLSSNHTNSSLDG
jgi:hypothetical protein